MRSRAAVIVIVTALALTGVVALEAPAGAAPAGSPVGSLDAVSPSFDDLWTLTGWAADPDAPGPVDIQIYMGSYGSPAGPANRPRADVAAALPWAGPNAGFSIPISAGWLKQHAGSDHLCVYAYNRNAGSSTLLGCRHLNAPGAPSPSNPIGSIDVATQPQGLLRLYGWAGDRGGDASTLVRIYDNGVPLTQFTADRTRVDVQAATGLANTGFDFTIPLYPGRHQVCLYAQNSGVGTSNTTLGCLTRTEPGPVAPSPHDPRGSYDSLTRGPCCTPQTLTSYPARGWAFDPDSPTTPVQIVLRNWNVPNIPQNGVREVTAATSLARPDVQAAFPGAGPSTGFGIDGSTYFPGYVPVCAWAKNIGPGTDRFLGCRWSSWT
jgi:hypothetical protein